LVRPNDARMEWVDVIRGFAVLCVVFYHVVIALEVASLGAPEWAERVNGVLSPYRMPLLMFLSGLLLDRALQKSKSVFVIGKLKRIGWPYVVWTVANIMFLIGASQLAGDGNYDLSRIPDLIVDPVTYTWYLAYLLVYYLLSLGLSPRARSLLVPILLAVSALIHDGDGFTRFAFLFAFFLLGDVAVRHKERWSALTTNAWALSASVALVITTAVLSLGGDAGRYGLASVSGILGVIVLARPLATLALRVGVLSPLQSMGRNSLVYYVTHWIAVTACVNVVDRTDVKSPSVVIVLLITAGLGASWTMVLLSKRLAPIRALYVFPDLGRRPTKVDSGRAGSQAT